MKKKNNHLIIGTSERIFNIVMNILGVIITVVCLYPIYYVLIASFSRPYYVDNGDVLFRIIGFTVDAYKRAFSRDGLFMAYGNTIFYTLVGLLFNMFFTTTMAYALSKKRLAWRKGLTLFVVFTMWFNAGVIPTYLNFRDFGLIDSRLSILLGFSINAYNLIILKSFFEQVPDSMEEAAFMDGASNMRIFGQIYLPLSTPALATVSLMYAVNRWNAFFWPMNLITSDEKLPLQVYLKKMIVDGFAGGEESVILTQSSTWSQTTMIYAVIIIAIIPMLIAYPFIQKYFKTGITLGANKG